MLRRDVGGGEGGIASGGGRVGDVLAREDLEEGCSGEGGGGYHGPCLGSGVGEGVGEGGEEGWVWEGGCRWVVFVEGAILDGDYWLGG